jgi:hypothetical protein
MSSQVQKPANRPAHKKVIPSPTPTLLAALSLLSISLGVTTETPADQPGLTPPNAREKTDGVKLARKAGKGQQEFLVIKQNDQHAPPSSPSIKTAPANPALQGNVLQKGTVGGSTGPTKPTLPVTGGQRQ